MYKTQSEEIYEAIDSGNAVLRQIEVVDGYLNSAENWGWFDLFSRKKLQDLRNQVQNILSDLNRYIYSRCGYSEEWIRTEDIDKVRSSKHQLPHKVG